MEQARLFRLAPEGINLSAYYEGGHGWTLIARMRRGDETWDAGTDERYSHMTSPELADVLAALVDGWLALG
jgi:hypothetical protein